MKQRTKIGVISLCLMALSACSSNATPKIVPQSKVVYPSCPIVPACHKPTLTIQTNGDLAQYALLANQNIEVCQLAIQTLQNCLTPRSEP